MRHLSQVSLAMSFAPLLLWPVPGASSADSTATAESRDLRIPRVSRPPRLQDFLTGTPREAESRVTDFRQYEPGDGSPSSQPTVAYLSYDANNLYVVFVCRDNPGDIRAHMSKREDIQSDDRVVVNIDTFHDRRHAYSFFSNPLGVQLDSFWTEGQGADDTWDTLWYSEGRLTADGYIVWIAIPFRSLRFPATHLQDWGILLGRAIQRNNEMSTWPRTTQRIESTAQQYGRLAGLEGISPGRNLQLIPYLASATSRSLDRSGFDAPHFRRDSEIRGGLDGKIVLRDALTLDLAINPDFSQVESDEPQATINQRFEVFFPEKRPFFLDNAGYFQTPINLFFSRRIADPLAGVRLTGKVGPWSVGGIAIDDRAPGERAPLPSPLRGEPTGIGVLRIQHESGNQSTVGLLVTNRYFGSSWNRVLALDTRWRLNSNWVFSGQFIRSYAREADGSRVAGPAYWAELSHSGRHFAFASRYADISPNFRADLGFVPRVDIRKVEHYIRYYWKPEGKRVVLFGPEVTYTLNWNRQGRLQDGIIDASFGGNFRGQTGMGCRHVNAFEWYQARGFRHHNTDCGINAGWLEWLEITADYGRGSAIDYFPAGGVTPFVAHARSAQAGFTWRPRPRFRLSGTYLWSQLGTGHDAGPGGASSRGSIFNNHILRTKMNYQLTRRLSLRAIVDYNATVINPSLVSTQPAKQLTGDLLAAYMLNPGTALYVGYTDIHENLRVLGDAAAMVRTGAPSLSSGRQFFVKVSYLLRP